MKLLLLLPPISPKERYGKLSTIGTLYPPLGLAYLAAYVINAGHSVKILDSEAEKSTYEDIYRICEQYKPDLVGIQTYCSNIFKANKVAAGIKNVIDTKIVFGGAHATLNPKETVSDKNVDFVICGEGEEALVRLLDAIQLSEYSRVPSLVYKEKGEIISNKPSAFIKDIDNIPFPARQLLPMDKYHSSANLRGKRTLNIMTSRGCPFRCAFCAGSLIFGKTHRYNSTKRVIEEIKLLIKDYNIDSLQFYDETFTVNKNRVIEMCEAMISEKLRITWSCFTRVNLVSGEILEKMKEAGCYLIFYGLESGVQRLLDLMDKGITLDDSKRAIELTHKAGIETWASFILGYPSETIEDSNKTIEFAINVNPTFVQFTYATPFPGTKLYEMAAKEGNLEMDWQNFLSWENVVYVPRGRTEEDIKNTVKSAYKRFYMRPGFLSKIALSMFKLPPDKLLRLVKAGLSTVFT